MSGRAYHDYVPLPRRNIWRVLFDIRPFAYGHTAEPIVVDHTIDLRPFSPKRPVRAAQRRGMQGAAVFLPTREIAPLLEQLFRTLLAIFVIVMFLVVGVWSITASRALIVSKKHELASAGSFISEEVSKGMTAFREFKFEEAREAFEDAAVRLDQVEYSIGPALNVVSFTARLLPENDYMNTVLLLAEAKAAFRTAAELADLADRTISSFSSSVLGGGDGIGPILKEIGSRLERLDRSLERISAYRNPFMELMVGEWFERLPEKRLELEEAASAIETIGNILGVTGTKTILLLFQNPAEIRPTGGFVGSYGIMRFERGALKEFSVDDIYNPDGQLKIKILPPRPLRRVTPVWGARDANWFFDFPLSAKKVVQFLQETSDRHFDAVIAVNPTIVSGLIGLTGPIEMPEYGKTITSANFWEEAQYQTRAGKDREINQPKRFLTVLGPLLLENLKAVGPDKFPALLDIFIDGLSRKDIIMWAEDPDIEELIAKRGWDGGVAAGEPGSDYLAVVLSNIGGAKADYVTTQRYRLETAIEPDGDIVNSLSITRIHKGDKAKYPWWKARNISYIKIYVPHGSTLIGVDGALREPPLIDIGNDKLDYIVDPDVATTIEAAVRLENEDADVFEESGKTVFGMWHAVDPGKSKTVTVRYALPFKIGFSPPLYTLLFQSQSGVPATFGHEVVLPNGSRLVSVGDGNNEVQPAFSGASVIWSALEIKNDIRHVLKFEFRPSI